MKAEIPIGGDPDPSLVLEPPLLLKIRESLLEKGIDIWMYLDAQAGLGTALMDIFDIPHDIIGDEYSWINFSSTVAGITYFCGINLDFGADTLTGDLHQAEFAEWKDGVLGGIPFHPLFHLLHQLGFVFHAAHVDKVDDDEATDIPQP